MSDNKVILIGGDHYNGLALVRAFGTCGIKPYGIIVGHNSKKGFLKKSKYWEKVWTINYDEEIILILQREFLNEDKRPLIIPWSDGAAAVIDKNLNELGVKYILPSIEKQEGRLFEMMDKGEQIAFAKDCNLHVAKSFVLTIPLTNIPEGIVYPCIVKPLVSCEGDKKDIQKISGKVQLQKYLVNIEHKGYSRILLQEFLNIDVEYDVKGYCNKSDSVYFVSQKVRTWPNVGGTTTLAFSIDESEINSQVDRIIATLKKINFSGLFDIEIFKVGDKYYFNEINWRNSAVCFAAIYSGVLYPLYWYYSVTEKDKINQKERADQYGIYAMNEFLDIKHIINGDVGLLEWIKDYKKSKARAYFNPHDMRPYLSKICAFVRHIFSR